MRDFFGHQDAARHQSRRMAVILAAAMLGTVASTAFVLGALTTILALAQVAATTNIEMGGEYWLGVFAERFWLAALLAAGVVVGAAVYKTLQLMESGGAELAKQLGGTRVHASTNDGRYQQLINVVEELALAGGEPTPKIFVLEDESGINAFAAGIEPKDTVVGVTRGALQQLDRDQLQGVLAHEFSHIVNRDVRINVLTFGALQGIEVVAAAAARLLRMGVASGANGSTLATAFGTVLQPVGQIGVCFGSLARMALNRQREYLADAAAVQFTRNPHGLSSALKLVAAQSDRGWLESPAAQTARHLFFAEGTSPLGDLLASHPPIADRIRRLDPEWDGSLPIVLPAEAEALLANSENDLAPAERDAATLDVDTPTEVTPSTIVESSPTSARMQMEVATLAVDDQYSKPEGVSEADHWAFLESVAKMREGSSPQAYDPNMTHWPTLAATAAVVICASALFTWFTSR